MANYCSTVRSNYFHVKDAESFKEMMSHVYGCEDTVELWEEKDKNGNSVFGFGVYGGISGIRYSDDDDDDFSYDAFIDMLQKCVADDDAIIILESGNEKLRYVVGSAIIITSLDYKYVDITNVAMKEAKSMLNNPLWKTKCEY